MTLLAAGTSGIGSKAIYLLFSAGAAWVADRKGYTERVGLTFGLILTFVGFFIVLLLPSRPGSVWREEGPVPKRQKPRDPAPPLTPPQPPSPPPPSA
jgi:hypothetical protein